MVSHIGTSFSLEYFRPGSPMEAEVYSWMPAELVEAWTTFRFPWAGRSQQLMRCDYAEN